jgi:hypothetical protein
VTRSSRSIPELERAVRSLTPTEIVRFAAVVKDLKTRESAADEPFWLVRTSGLKLTGDDKRMLGDLFTRMNAALIYAATGENVEDWIDRPGVMAAIERRLGSRSRAIEGRAATVLEKTFGGEVHIGVVGIWNSLCAALLGERLDPRERDSLGAAWRGVRGASLR